MSTLKVNSIANNGSAVDLPNGAFNIGGKSILQGYTSSATEPASASTGDFWWDSTNEELYQYLNGEFKEISTVVRILNIADFSYDSVSFSVSGQDSSPMGMAISPDGTKMYMSGASTDDIYQYTLSTAFDLSTASYDNVNMAYSTNNSGVAFKPDGTKMYITSYSNDDVRQYTLSTAWDLSTASYDSVSFSVSGQDSAPYDLTFSTDGTKMYFSGGQYKRIHQYSLSTAWDLSTASYDSVYLDVSTDCPNLYGAVFSEDGLQLFAICASNQIIQQYSLTTEFDLSTASLGDDFSVSSAGFCTSIVLSSNQEKIYILSSSNDAVFQYSTNF